MKILNLYYNSPVNIRKIVVKSCGLNQTISHCNKSRKINLFSYKNIFSIMSKQVSLNDIVSIKMSNLKLRVNHYRYEIPRNVELLSRLR